MLLVGTSSSRIQNFGKASGITALPGAYVSRRVFDLADDLAGVATGGYLDVTEFNKGCNERNVAVTSQQGKQAKV